MDQDFQIIIRANNNILEEELDLELDGSHYIQDLLEYCVQLNFLKVPVTKVNILLNKKVLKPNETIDSVADKTTMTVFTIELKDSENDNSKQPKESYKSNKLDNLLETRGWWDIKKYLPANTKTPWNQPIPNPKDLPTLNKKDQTLVTVILHGLNGPEKFVIPVMLFQNISTIIPRLRSYLGDFAKIAYFRLKKVQKGIDIDSTFQQLSSHCDQNLSIELEMMFPGD